MHPITVTHGHIMLEYTWYSGKLNRFSKLRIATLEPVSGLFTCLLEPTGSLFWFLTTCLA